MEIIIVLLLFLNLSISILIIIKLNHNVSRENNSKLINDYKEHNNKNLVTIIKELKENNQILLKKHSDLEIVLNKTIINNNEKLVERFLVLEKNLLKEQKESTENLILKFVDVENHLNTTLNTFNENFKTSLDGNIEKLISSVEIKLNNINDKVEDRLKSGFQKTTETFNSIIERLAKIDEAQKNIESLSGNIISLQDILSDKKTRGIFGEVQLYQILNSVFGEESEKTYKKQYLFKNGTIADAVLFAPEPLGSVVIDSKFPLENYKRIVDKELSKEERKIAQSNFKLNMKKHIDDISSKYIIEGVTSNQAILFLPAEAIFAEINAYYGDIIEYGQRKRVWIASPTTIMAVLNTLQIVIKDVERQKYAHEIQIHLGKLAEEFNRYKSRWDNLSKDIDKVTKDIKEINITSNKISKRFTSISNVEEIE